MKGFLRFRFITPLFVVILFVSAFSSCEKSNDTATIDYTPALQSMLDTEWTAFWEGKANPVGGFMMKISSPNGDFFVSSQFNDSVTEHFHFRGASTTKTFTAAAIMLLAQ